jgi:hypothetical protein
MTKAEFAMAVEARGTYCKVRVAADGQVTGMLVNQDYRYDPHSNTGGRRLIGEMPELACDYGWTDER